MDPKGRDGNTVSEYHICKNDLYGKFWNQPKAYDKLSVVMVTLDERQETGDEYLNMMNTLLSTEKTVEAKKKELLEQYSIICQWKTSWERRLILCVTFLN